ncbi:helix-turn-helix domain-containing protein [Stenotrophomonas maltophilia]|nr:helix-turn-helix domain-containing protein [Stenotrophomonas maltophilia]
MSGREQSVRSRCLLSRVQEGRTRDRLAQVGRVLQPQQCPGHLLDGLFKRAPIPPVRWRAIEQLTVGAVTRQDLRPDIFMRSRTY